MGLEGDAMPPEGGGPECRLKPVLQREAVASTPTFWRTGPLERRIVGAPHRWSAGPLERRLQAAFWTAGFSRHFRTRALARVTSPHLPHKGGRFLDFMPSLIAGSAEVVSDSYFFDT